MMLQPPLDSGGLGPPRESLRFISSVLHAVKNTDTDARIGEDRFSGALGEPVCFRADQGSWKDAFLLAQRLHRCGELDGGAAHGRGLEDPNC